jgi:hypothetical protein
MSKKQSLFIILLKKYYEVFTLSFQCWSGWNTYLFLLLMPVVIIIMCIIVIFGFLLSKFFKYGFLLPLLYLGKFLVKTCEKTENARNDNLQKLNQ